MPFQVPSLADARRLVRDHMAARLPGAESAPGNSRIRVLGDAIAALAHLVFLYVTWLSRQFLPDTAEREWLDRHADIWLGGRKPAAYAEGSVTVTGLSGTVIPEGTRLASTSAIEYETTEPIMVGVAPTPLPIRAVTPGAAGNRDTGAVLSFSTAVPGVDGTATVVTLTGGADAENDDDLRDRVLARIRKPPMGGCKYDYEAWALEVPGVTRAWCAPLEMGIGTVTVRVMLDDLRADNGGFPLVQDIEAVTAHLDVKRPVAVKDFFVLGPIPHQIDLTITGLAVDDAATRAAIEASLRRMLRDRAVPGQTIYRSWVGEAVSIAAREEHHELVFTTTPMPSPGHMAVLGTISFSG